MMDKKLEMFLKEMYAKIDETLAEGILIVPQANNAWKWFKMRMDELRAMLKECPEI